MRVYLNDVVVESRSRCVIHIDCIIKSRLHYHENGNSCRAAGARSLFKYSETMQTWRRGKYKHGGGDPRSY